MKTFIIFMAFLVIFSSCLVFSEDSRNYVRLQEYLKALAEECAAGGVLMKDASSAADSYIVNTEDARLYAEFMAGGIQDENSDSGTRESEPSALGRNFAVSLTPLRHGTVKVEKIMAASSMTDAEKAAYGLNDDGSGHSYTSAEKLYVEVSWTANPGYRIIRLPFLSSPDTVSQRAVYEVVK